MSDTIDRLSSFRLCLRITLVVCLLSTNTLAVEPCRIEVVDQSNGWPVPMVELETTNHIRFVTDNAGLVAFDLPELMNTPTWLHVRGHGYSVAPDGFGFRGVRIIPVPGKTFRIEVQRELAAKRLGRLTGGGLFSESQKLGEANDWREQNLLGCDSVQNAIFNEKLFWLWGDTTLAGYPLGRFHSIAATTAQTPLPSLVPPIGLRFDYFNDDQGTPRDIARMPGDGPTWLFGMVSLPDQNGQHRLGATYSKIKGPLTEYEKGLCVWNEQTEQFDRHRVIWKMSEQDPSSPLMPHGHSVFWTDQHGEQWVLFGDPFPTIRCRATFEDWSTPKRWESIDTTKTVEMANSKQTIRPHRGAIAFNAYRDCWVTIFTQTSGNRSELGEIWYAESTSPMGPWSAAIKVVTHDKYTFYNPQIHAEWVDKNSPVLLFEGTYTSTFSKAKTPTPRYDYNQILYRLDLDTLRNSKDAP
ncbi:hypothetical protein [Novipirellula herctigrandis]